MAGIWFGAIVSLSGVIVGAVATYFSQERLWKRTTRRELYGNFVGLSNICRDLLLEVSYAIRHKLPEGERNARWTRANEQIADVSSHVAQVSMVATTRTRRAAEALEQHLLELRIELYKHTKNDTASEASSVYRDAYRAVLDDFIAAASMELGITRT